MGRNIFIVGLIVSAIGCGGGGDDSESGGVAAEENLTVSSSAVSNVFVQIPTDVGNLWCRIFFPEETGHYRYGEEGPVMVYTDGNTTAWSLNGSGKTPLTDFERLAQEGFVVITWHLPGTSESIDGVVYSSDGTFDYRGEDSIAGLRDILKFAMGSLTTSDGLTLTQIASGAQTNNVGLVGFSNGGNLCWATLDQYGSELSNLGWYVGYETPIDNEIRAVGRIHSDPDSTIDATGTGFAADDGFNPHSGTWTEGQGWSFATEKLVHNTTSGKNMTIKYADGTVLAIPGIIFFDGNENGYPDQIQGNYDINGNGYYDETEDFAIGGVPTEINGNRKIVLPIRIRQAMPDLPSQVATLTETIEYWSKREMAAGIPVGAAQIADLKTILFYSKLDHDLPAFPGNSHAHIYSGYALHVDNGLWVRLNPDKSYVEQIFLQEGLTAPSTFQENEANLPENVRTESDA